jgi:hypothetical protein
MGESMSIRKRDLGCGWCLALMLLFVTSAWAQIAPHEYAYTLRSTSMANLAGKAVPSLLDLTQAPQGITVANATEPKESTLPVRSGAAVNDTPSREKAASQELMPCGSTRQTIQVVADQSSVDKAPPATLTIRTAALLELHEMRQSAVDLCLQLPSKYRTQLPQCADIFRHEIRLKTLAKERP